MLLKNLLGTILLIASYFCCLAQDGEFEEYLKGYADQTLPIRLFDTKSYQDIFYLNKEQRNIPSNFVKQFICEKEETCETDPSNVRYLYGVKFKVQEDVRSVLVQKMNFGKEGDNVCDFDLAETILINYDENGNILSKLIIGKDNDCWISEIEITESRIDLRQFEITTFSDDTLSCNIYETNGRVLEKGKSDFFPWKFIEKGVLIWDESHEEFRPLKMY